MSSNRADPSVNAWNSEFIERLYAQWKVDPQSVDPQWQQFFQGFDLGISRSGETITGSVEVAHTLQGKVDSLIYHYRSIGHLAADLDPLGSKRPFPEYLTLDSFDLGDDALDQQFDPGTIPLENPTPLQGIISTLEETYCNHIGIEYMHIQDREKRRWLQRRMETVRNRPEFSNEMKIRILEQLINADCFESFLQTRYIGKKRFGIEGGESLIPILDQIIEMGPASDVVEFAIGMAHRGRLNVLANILNKTWDQIFTEFEESWVEDFLDGGGDVKYHQGFSSTRETSSGRSVRLTLAANPSHLEFAGPVVLGRARAKQRLIDDQQRDHVIPVLIHGDAAFPGQGIVAETLNMMNLDGYTVGGTIHIVVNNQIGFTTNHKDAFSGHYCTDIAKMVDAPIFHVNGDDPQACAWVARLAFEYRQAFHNDVVVDMWCYRKHGHNETDEPTFTQPVMYQAIRDQDPVLQLYKNELIDTGVIDQEEFDQKYQAVMDQMDKAQERTQSQPVDPTVNPFQSIWSGLKEEYDPTPIHTGIPIDRAKKIIETISDVPGQFKPHKTIGRGLQQRRKTLDASQAPIDWATGELLAYGSLLVEGHAVRVTGQDVERGTFSHRHSVVFDQETGEPYCALNHIEPDQAKFCIHNSPLTESACVAFEYGYSLADPQMLIIWEAQFGDFANGAQVIFDQFLASAEAKWQRFSGLVLFLPHGYEGQGPEHSSARMERFLQLCADENMQVAYPSSSAQMFHLLRRQMKQDFRKPLVIMTPKSMLRLPAANSPLEAFVDQSFQRVIQDPEAPSPSDVQRIIFCTGKIYHELNAARQSGNHGHVSLNRIEQLYPFPEQEVMDVINSYPEAVEVTWVQEEPRNMGGFSKMFDLFENTLGVSIKYLGREESASPAVGSSKIHAKQQQEIIDGSLAALRKEAKTKAAGKGTSRRSSKKTGTGGRRSRSRPRP